MSDEIQGAVQIIRVGYEGIEIAMKVGAGGLSAMKQAVEFLKGIMDYEKSIGKTSMRKLLMKGGNLQVFQFKTADMAEVEKLAKKYGILYSKLPDLNLEDDLSEIVFHSEAVPRVNMMIQKLKDGKIAGLEEYLKNGDKEQLGKYQKFFKEHNIATADVTVKEQNVDDVSRNKELTERVDIISKAQNPDLMDVTIDKSLITEETETQVKTRVPGTFGENVRYVWFDKEDVAEINEGKTLLTFLDKQKEYHLYDNAGQVLERMYGKKLCDEHYDRVNAEVRKRYEKSLAEAVVKPKVPKQKKV